MVDYVKPVGIDKLWSDTGPRTPVPSDSKISSGWEVEIPPKEIFNFIHYKVDLMLAYLNQKGIPQWDAGTEYIANKSFAVGSNGVVYKAKLTHTSVNPVTEIGAVNWGVAFYSITDVYTKSESDTLYARRSNNLSDLSNLATSRSNLGVYSTTDVNNIFASKGANLSDLSNPALAFFNIKQTATPFQTGCVQIAQNADITFNVNGTNVVNNNQIRQGFAANLSTAGNITLPEYLGSYRMQWDKISIGKGFDNFVTLSFPTACVFFACGFAETVGRGDVSVGGTFISNTQAVIRYHQDGSGGSPRSIWWLAIGY